MLLLNTCPVGHVHISVGKFLHNVSPDLNDLKLSQVSSHPDEQAL